MGWKEVLVVGAIFIVIIGLMLGLVWFMLLQETKSIEGEVIDVEILHNGFTSYWKIYFKDGTMIEARPNAYGGNTYDFVKNSRVLIQFSRQKNIGGYWNIDCVIKLPDLVEGE